MAETTENEGTSIKADVVVLGGGGSGLPAAVAAREAGAERVVIVDKRKFLGGSARMAGGFFAVESPAQERLGITHTADECFRAVTDASNWMVDARLVGRWMRGSKHLVDWLEQKGVEFGPVIAFTGTSRLYHQVSDQPSTTGNKIMERLVKDCEAYGVEVLLDSTALKLLTDQTGAVTGVKVSRDGQESTIVSKTVIIATGSVSGNRELVQRFYPEVDMDQIRIIGAFPWASGDGYLMAKEIGAATNGWPSTLWIGPHNHPNNDHVAMVARRPECILVNKNGRRYIDESIAYTRDFGWYAGANLERQPGMVAWGLMDEATKRHLIEARQNICGVEDVHGRVAQKNQQGNIELGTSKELRHEDGLAWWDEVDDDLRSEAEAGRVLITDSLDEIAGWIGSAPEVLKATIAEYNRFCADGHDKDFLKPPEFLRPVQEPPFYCVAGREGIDTCVGGIRIDSELRVLGPEFRPIPGLYATGVATSGWLGHGYGYWGSELGYSLWSGYAVGKIVAEYCKTIS